MAGSKGESDVAKMSFEEALEELLALVKSLEKGETKLDEAVRQYQRGMDLKRHCEKKLREAQEKVDKIVLSPDGSIGSEPAKLD
jgi:exodeoxyribonuclease VII small subunit